MHVLPKEEWSDYASHLPSLEKRITCDVPKLTCIDCATPETNPPAKYKCISITNELSTNEKSVINMVESGMFKDNLIIYF